MRVKDAAGNIVGHMDRAPSGGLIVNDKNGYNKYMIEKHKTAEVEQIREELAQLKTMVQLLLSKQHGIPTL